MLDCWIAGLDWWNSKLLFDPAEGRCPVGVLFERESPFDAFTKHRSNRVEFGLRFNLIYPDRFLHGDPAYIHGRVPKPGKATLNLQERKVM